MLQTETLSIRDQVQRDRKELAKGAWREGNLDNALLIIRSVLSEEMSPAVAAECYSTEAAILADMGDFEGSLEALHRMSPVLDAADVRVQGTFYNGRARAHKNLGDIDAALTDYAGAVALWQVCGDRNYEGAASINLAELYLSIKDLHQANHNADHALKVLPKDSEYLCNAYDTKAKVLVADGQLPKALSLIERALELAGEHGEWLKRFSETRAKIKELLLDSLVPVVNMADVEYLKAQMVRNALDRANGSITVAAKILGTSHQVIAYTADQKGFERSRRKKSIIKHLS